MKASNIPCYDSIDIGYYYRTIVQLMKASNIPCYDSIDIGYYYRTIVQLMKSSNIHSVNCFIKGKGQADRVNILH